MNALFVMAFRRQAPAKLCRVIVIGLVAASLVNGWSQGIVIFNNQVAPHGTNYYEQGMLFRVTIPTVGSGNPSYDGMVVGDLPYRGTPYMLFYQQFSPDDYVSFNLTNGYTFGLTSVDLADPNSPSSSLVPISFIGLLANGNTVTNTFTTPGGGATTFQNYLFTSAFSSGLVSVDILSTRWAMDNLVFGNVVPVPEPGAVGLIAAGLLAIAARKIRRHQP